MTREEAIDDLGTLADDLENARAAMNLPMPAAFHVEQLKVILPQCAERLRKAYIAVTGDNPWSTHP